MTPLTFPVLRLLADGGFRSGEAIARHFQVSRATVWHALADIGQIGVELYKIPGRGYRLARPVEFLDVDAICHWLADDAGRFAVEIADMTSSTNTDLVQRAGQGAASGSVIAAEWQSHGRGRRGRAWHTEFGGALTFSLLWRFEQGAGDLAGLSLAVGVALVRALKSLGVSEARLKWPNDVLWRGAKLAGVLIEVQGEMQGPSAAVIGIGLNMELAGAVRQRIDQPAVDLQTACGTAVERNRTLAVLLREAAQVIDTFAREGFAPLRDEWQQYHVHQERAVMLVMPDGRQVHGTAAGVADDGALLLRTAAGVRHFHSGELSLRAA
ncbi:MAG TPA: biotin--[acetyl-CoA-carboxylase] ligase [Burkholderiales bacterium]|jgi:BirA family biotin operon repressor/biotin-[acetyl-CoA-carboxylase] ligase|nr:biotin--[acetyl-CoA-carboxylase] ligase [Burkholderiales bacterium]